MIKHSTDVTAISNFHAAGGHYRAAPSAETSVWSGNGVCLGEKVLTEHVESPPFSQGDPSLARHA